MMKSDLMQLFSKYFWTFNCCRFSLVLITNVYIDKVIQPNKQTR